MNHLLLILIWLIVTDIVAQTIYSTDDFDRYTIKDGLIDNNIFSLTTDSLNYIWCGTENGLARFNGQKFLSFSSQVDANIIKGNHITKVKMLSNNYLAIHTKNGLSILNASIVKSEHISLMPHLSDDIFNIATDIAELEFGHLAIGGVAGFFVLDKNRNVKFSYSPFSKMDIGKRRIYYVVDMLQINSYEVLLYIQDHQLYHYDLRTNIYKKIQSTDLKYKHYMPWNYNWTIKSQVSNHEVVLLSEQFRIVRYINQATGLVQETKLPKHIYDLWWNSKIIKVGENKYALICRNNGFYIFSINKESGKIIFDTSRHLVEYRCYDILRLNIDKLIIATDKGLLVQKDIDPFLKSTNLKSLTNQRDNLFIKSILRKKDEIIAACYSKGHNLIWIDAMTGKLIKSVQFGKDITYFEGISQMDFIDEYNLLLITNRGAFRFDIRNNKAEVFDNRISLDSEIPINRSQRYIHFLSYYSGRISRYDKKKRVLEEINYLADSLNLNNTLMWYDTNDDLYIAGYGINKITPSGVSTIYESRSSAKAENRYFSLCKLRKESLFLSNEKGQLIDYNLNKRYNNKTYYNETYRNAVTVVSSIGNLILFSTGQNLSIIDTENKKITELHTLKNFPEEKIFCRSNAFNIDTTVVFTASNNHLLSINLNKKDSIKQKPILSTVVIESKDTLHHPSSKFSLPYNENGLEFRFSLPIYTSEIFSSYYKLDDGQWQLFTENIRFNLLAFGKHTLNIKYEHPLYNTVSNTFVFTLNPPIYKAKWFYGICILLISSVLYFETKRRFKLANVLHSLNQKLSESEMNALRAQMNPHFVFNSLNSIKGLIVQNKNNEASLYLSKFANLIRQNLSHSTKNFISIKDQITYLDQYLNVEQLRFELLSYEIKTNGELDEISELIPSMILQPIVENAIWHGQDIDTGVCNITIEFAKHDDKINITIEDQGIGINQDIVLSTERNNIALKNIKERISLYNQKYNIECTLQLYNKRDNKEGKGTKVVVRYNSINE